MLYRTVFLSLAFFCMKSCAQVSLCPETFPEECTCTDRPEGPEVECITIPMESWDIRATFDEIADTINNNNTILYKIQVFVGDLGQEQEVPAHSVSSLKAQELYISAHWKLTRIDPDAFSGTHDTVTALGIRYTNFSSSQDAFDLINNFKLLQYLDMDGNYLSTITENAFGADLGHLQTVFLTVNGIESIGANAFSGPPNLTYVSLYDNNLSIDQIADTAFNFAAQGVTLSLKKNAGISYLPQEKFGQYLNGNNSLIVGNSGTVDPIYYLFCDERADWLCDTHLSQIEGYFCKGEDYRDIYDYCEQRSG